MKRFFITFAIMFLILTPANSQVVNLDLDDMVKLGLEINQELAIKQMNYQLEFTRERAGWSTHSASIGDNL